MADIEISRAHNLGLKAARAAAERMAEHLSQRFGLEGDWEGNTLGFRRPGVSGSLAIDDRSLRLVVNLGFLLKAMRPSIEKAVLHELDALFAREQPTEPAPRKAAAKAPPGSKKASARPKKAARGLPSRARG